MAFWRGSTIFAHIILTLVFVSPVCNADYTNSNSHKPVWCVQGTLTNNKEAIKYVSCDEEYKQIHDLEDGHWIPPITHCVLFADTQKNKDRDGYDWIVSGGCDFDRVCIRKYPSKEDRLIHDATFNKTEGTLFCCNSSEYYCNDPRFTLNRNETSVLNTCFKGALNTTTNQITGMFEPCGVGVYCTVQTDSHNVEQYFCDDDNLCYGLTIQEHNKTCNKAKNRGACCCKDSFCNKPPGAVLTRNILVLERAQPNNLADQIMFYFTIVLGSVLSLVISIFCLSCCIKCNRSAIDRKYLEKFRDHHLQFEDSEAETEECCEAQHEAAATNDCKDAGLAAVATGPLPAKQEW